MLLIIRLYKARALKDDVFHFQLANVRLCLLVHGYRIFVLSSAGWFARDFVDVEDSYSDWRGTRTIVPLEASRPRDP